MTKPTRVLRFHEPRRPLILLLHLVHLRVQLSEHLLVHLPLRRIPQSLQSALVVLQEVGQNRFLPQIGFELCDPGVGTVVEACLTSACGVGIERDAEAWKGTRSRRSRTVRTTRSSHAISPIFLDALSSSRSFSNVSQLLQSRVTSNSRSLTRFLYWQLRRSSLSAFPGQRVPPGSASSCPACSGHGLQVQGKSSPRHVCGEQETST